MKYSKKIISIALPLLLAVFFGWYTFSTIEISTITPHFKNANYWWVGLGVCCGLISHLSRAYRWRYMLEALGYKTKLPNHIMAVFIAYFANYGIPRSGEVLRAAVLTNYEGVPFEKGFGTIIAERIADLLVMMCVIAITLFLQFEYIYQLLAKTFDTSKIVIGIIILSVLIIVFFVFIKRSPSKTAKKIRLFLKGLLEGVLSIFKMKKNKMNFIGHTLFIWVMYILMFYLTSFAVQDLYGISIGAILVGFVSASFTIAATNGGIFFYPLAIGFAFSLFNIPESPSIAFGWIVWTSQTLMLVLLGAISFVLLPIYNRTKTSIKD